MSEPSCCPPSVPPSVDDARCCAEFYEQEWVSLLLGESFHPGGLALTARLWEDVGAGDRARVLDVAAGRGTTAVHLTKTYGAYVTAVDISEKNLERGKALAAEAGVADRISWVCGASEKLPFADRSFEVVLCECALSTFDDKPKVVSEFFRVLQAGGALGLSDMAKRGQLPAELAEKAESWACVKDALDVPGYQRLLLDAGLRIAHYEDESASLNELLLDIKRKLVVVGLGKLAGGLSELDLDLPQLRKLLSLAKTQGDVGKVQYLRMVATKGRRQTSKIVAKKAVEACNPRSGCC